MSSAAGAILSGKYRLVRPLGEGGMGQVWVAQHLELEREVAVKLLAPTQREAAAYQRFEREARLAAKLQSPNVAQIHDYGWHDGQPYLVMELLRGEDLLVRLERRTKLSLDEVVELVDALCAALGEAHGHGIVHRDIKPANIFFAKVGGREVIKVLDFGIATRRAVSRGITGDGMIIGTPQYMSPEQSQARDIDQRSDLWSIAVVAYEALTGVQPFDAATAWESLAAISKRAVSPPSEHVSTLPGTVDEFFVRALRRAPSSRYANAHQLAQGFVAAARGESPEPATPLADTTPMPMPARPPSSAAAQAADTDVVAIDQARRPSPSAVWPLLAAAAMVVAAVGWVMSRGAAGAEPAARAVAGLAQAIPMLPPATTAREAEASPATSASSDAPGDRDDTTLHPPMPPKPATPAPVTRPQPQTTAKPKAQPTLQPQPKPKQGANEFGI